ncbi:hypothetical protein [Actinocorallia longicatena]|uniref:Uncharacterized protein n=1 Tax=Actinocorallia longicatena TaxID=111803 RepID=A0ABP6QBB0_9ACTN
MSLMSALARMEALTTGRAQPLATRRHFRLAGEPLVIVPLKMAGEAAAPLAALVGTSRREPQLIFAPQPRNRDLRFAFFGDLAKAVLGEIAARQVGVESVERKNDDPFQRFLDAPQLLVPNRPGMEFLRLLGRSTRFRQTGGEWPVPEAVPLLGRWLTWFSDRSEYPGSSVLCAMTDLLSTHWATGQSALEDGNLAALLGWIDPPPGRTGPQAAKDAEDPLVQPPAGPSTDPSFDNEVLAPLIASYDQSQEGPGRDHAADRIRKAILSQVEPTWELMWQGIDLLRALPEAGSVTARFEGDRTSFSLFEASMEEGVPQARKDSAVAAARRLASLEGQASRYAVQRALDDPLIMAEHRLSGEAFAGDVVWADPDHVNEKDRPRPLLRISTTDALRAEPGAVLHNAARKQKAIVREIGADGVLVELQDGMGRAKKPALGTVPELGEAVCFTTFADEFRPGSTLPDADETPWTHGGPPEPYEAPAEVVTEEMSAQIIEVPAPAKELP